MSIDDDVVIETKGGPFTRGELRQRVTLLTAGIVLTRDVPKASAESWEFMARRTEELGGQFPRYVMVMDLSEATGRPKGAHKEMIRHTLVEVVHPIHLAVVQPGSAMLRTVLRFVIANVADRSSVHPTLEEALTAARRALEARA